MVRIFSSGPLERMRLANQIQGFRIPAAMKLEKKILLKVLQKRGVDQLLSIAK